jgi:hypothetical protein
MITSRKHSAQDRSRLSRQAQRAAAVRAVFGGDEGEPAQRAAAAAAADAAKQIKLEEQLAKLRRDNAFAQLDDLSKIEALQRELNSLHQKSLDFSVDEEEHTKALIAEEQKRKELGDLQAKLDKEKADYAAQEAATREKMAETAEKELADSREAVKEQGLRSGRAQGSRRARKNRIRIRSENSRR